MDKPICAIEITSDSIKLVIGYELNGKVHAIYSLNKKLGVIKKDGRFLDSPRVMAELIPLKELTDEPMKLKIKISEICLTLPPNGLMVYQTNQLTPVLADTGKIDSIDIKSLFTLIKKNRFGFDSAVSEIVDVIPERYVLDEGRTYSKMPLGEVTSTLNLVAKVHVLPIEISRKHVDVIEGAGMKIKNLTVAPYAAVELIGTDEDMPIDYFLVDMGSRTTTVSLVGNKRLYASKVINFGGSDITHKIEEAFNISEEEAETIKCSYGLNNREMNFEAPVSTFVDEDGHEVKHSEKELSSIIKEELDRFVIILKNTINELIEKENPTLKTLPILLIGGGSLLNGLVKYLEPKVDSTKVQIFIPKTLGCRNPSLTNLLGTIYLQGQEKVTIEKNSQQIGELSRIE